MEGEARGDCGIGCRCWVTVTKTIWLHHLHIASTPSRPRNGSFPRSQTQMEGWSLWRQKSDQMNISTQMRREKLGEEDVGSTPPLAPLPPHGHRNIRGSRVERIRLGRDVETVSCIERVKSLFVHYLGWFGRTSQIINRRSLTVPVLAHWMRGGSGLL